MKARVRRLVKRVQASLPARVLVEYGTTQAGNYALALAFAGLLAMFPMILGALAIAGLAIRDPQTEARVQVLILEAFPGSAQPELQKAILGVKQSAGWLGVVSLAGVLWGASSFFAALEFALTNIFGTRTRNLLWQRVAGLATMLVVVVAIVVLVAMNAAVAFVPLAWWATWVIGFLAGAIVLMLLLVALYRFVPNRKLRMRDVFPGAVLAGVLIEILSLAFPLYAKVAGNFNTYGAEFALFFLLATWFYLLSQLIVLGAVLNKVLLDEAVGLSGAVGPVRARPKTAG